MTMIRRTYGVHDDPRPDLAHDSKDWKRLLAPAAAEDIQLAWILHAFRCVGLRLHKDGNGYSLRPEFDPKSSQWTSQARYEEDKDKWLMPYREKIIKVLDGLSKTNKS